MRARNITHICAVSEGRGRGETFACRVLLRVCCAAVWSKRAGVGASRWNCLCKQTHPLLVTEAVAGTACVKEMAGAAAVLHGLAKQDSCIWQHRHACSQCLVLPQ